MSLSDLLHPKICELGKIKIGGKDPTVRQTQSGGTWRAPVKFDHFIVTSLQRDAKGDLVPDADLMAELTKEYGDKSDGKLRQLPIRLLSNDIDDAMQAAWVWYSGKTVGARSDGHEVTWLNDPTNGKRMPASKTEPWKPEFADLTNTKGQKLFKLHTTFNCVIGSKESRWGGVYKLRTTSRITADQLYGSLIHLSQLTGGILIGLPLMLVVRPIQVAPEGKPTTVYVVHCELRGPDLQAIQSQALQLAQFQLANARQIQETRQQFRKLLAAPGTEGEREAADIAEEFAPETTVEEAPPTEPDPLIEGTQQLESAEPDDVPLFGSEPSPEEKERILAEERAMST